MSVTNGTEDKLWGLIPAAGKGTRAFPYTENRHKALLDVNGVANIERIISIMRDDLQITDIVIVIGHLGDSIRNHLGDGDRLNVRLAPNGITIRTPGIWRRASPGRYYWCAS